MISSIKSTWQRWVGPLLLFLFGIFCLYRFQTSSLIYFLMLAFRDFLASIFFVIRREGTVTEKRSDQVIAFISSALPICYLTPSQDVSYVLIFICKVLAIIGTLISTLALIELGRSFGVFPANRGIVRTGLYKYLNHPMYTGYFVAELGMALINGFNIPIFLLSMALYFYRAKRENTILAETLGNQKI